MTFCIGTKLFIVASNWEMTKAFENFQSDAFFFYSEIKTGKDKELFKEYRCGTVLPLFKERHIS